MNCWEAFRVFTANIKLILRATTFFHVNYHAESNTVDKCYNSLWLWLDFRHWKSYIQRPYIFSLLMPCIQGSAHLPWLLSLSFKEFESTSKLPNFPSAVSCFSGAMASLVVRLVLNVSLNSAITLPFLHKMELKKWNHNHHKLRPPSACIRDILDKEISFLRFQQQYAFTRGVFESISHCTSTWKRLKTMETKASLTEYFAEQRAF